ncbi:hypothetical protein [Crenobacter intestini]|uniref:Ryanodine receptor Ryr domain-containing protein n=1 Tax=Crenobacter intestini TaxID=2563443 RepID=A0A4V4N7E6_9NEIS|nr:hypothetical protein [Crenobacter intestini]TIC80283.1 hypothetical protein E5K04_12300 [Crenobacter intestini]
MRLFKIKLLKHASRSLFLDRKKRNRLLEIVAFIIFIFAAALAIVGLIGVDEKYSFDLPVLSAIFSVFFKILQMIVLNYGWGESKSDLVHAAMFLFPLSMSLAIVGLIWSKVALHIRRLCLNLFCKNHVIIVGGDDIAASLAICHASHSLDKKSEVVILGDFQNSIILDKLKLAGVSVIPESVFDIDDLIGLGADRARLIYLLSQEASMPEVVRSLSKRLTQSESSSNRYEPTIFAWTDNDIEMQELIDDLPNQNKVNPKNQSFIIRPINIWKHFAYKILMDKDNSPSAIMRGKENESWNIVLLGENDSLKRQIIKQSAILLRKDYAKDLNFYSVSEQGKWFSGDLKLDSPVFVDDEEFISAYWLGMERNLVPILKFSCLEKADFYTRVLVSGENLIVYICANDELEASKLIANVRKYKINNNDKLLIVNVTPVFDVDVGEDVNSSNKKDVGSINLLDRLLTWKMPDEPSMPLFVGAALDRGAQSINMAYQNISGLHFTPTQNCNKDHSYDSIQHGNSSSIFNENAKYNEELEKCVDIFFQDNSSSENKNEWQEMQEWARESSRQSFIHAKILRDRFQCLENVKNAYDFFKIENFDEILKYEHDRWVAERLYLGWRYVGDESWGKDKKGMKNRKMHNDIKPYSALGAEERRKDLACVLCATLILNRLENESTI